MALDDLALDELDIISNEHYGRNGYPHQEWARLRREAPVHWVERRVDNPFWAITKYADVVEISKQPGLFENGPRLAVFPGLSVPSEAERQIRHLLNMDPPVHGTYRRIASGRFTPRGIAPFVTKLEEIARDLLDEMFQEGADVEADFVQAFSARLPLEALCRILGVPRNDWRLLYDWTNAIIGSADPEFQEEGDDQFATTNRARMSLFGYFNDMVTERRKQPSDDLVSLLANSEIDGGPLPPVELLSYCFLLVVAGNETTRNATSGGLLALIENPGELAKLRAHPELLKSAVEEIVRFTSPVIQFCRTPNRDVVIRGQQIAAGENLCLFYPSANRDEDVFDAPSEFRVDRRPNPHVGFGIGEHFCLGANLARLELRVAFRELLTRLEDVELAGNVDRLSSSFVGGIKRMPIRYRLSAA